MIRRWAEVVGWAVLASMLKLGSAFAQTQPTDVSQPGSSGTPTIEYIVVVLLLALPVALVCRSSRR